MYTATEKRPDFKLICKRFLPKCVCLRGSAPGPAGGLTAPPDPQLEKVGFTQQSVPPLSYPDLRPCLRLALISGPCDQHFSDSHQTRLGFKPKANSVRFCSISVRPGDHAPFLETDGNCVRLGRSVYIYISCYTCNRISNKLLQGTS